MTNSTQAERQALKLGTGTIIIRHPETGRPGRWVTVSGARTGCPLHVELDYTSDGGEEGMFIVRRDDMIPIEISAAEQQAACATALVSLLAAATRQQLPSADWVVSNYNPVLSAHVNTREDFAAWAAHLNAEIDDEKPTGNKYLLMAKGTHEGVAVRVQAYADAVAEAPAEVTV